LRQLQSGREGRVSRRASRGAAAEIRQRRIDAQRLSTTTFASAAEAVAWFGAVQAQDYLGALWAVGLRLNAVHETDVERAVANREIVRSWPMRGTLHFMASADARWMIGLLAPRAARLAAGRVRSLGIDAGVLSRARHALVTELEGGKCLARPDAHRVLERARIDTSNSRGLTILWQLAHEGLLCMGARQGKQHTFVLLDEWLPPGKALRGDEALGELACRYFAGHGPATARDLAWWSGLSLTDASRAIDVAGTHLREERLDGMPFWSVGNEAGLTPRSDRSRAQALPPFDEFFVGYADRTAPLDAAQLTRLSSVELLGPTVVHEGRLVASWKRRFTRGKVVCATTPQTELTASQRAAVRRAYERYAGFLQADLELQEGPGVTKTSRRKASRARGAGSAR
jgi:hypothetical protein